MKGEDKRQVKIETDRKKRREALVVVIRDKKQGNTNKETEGRKQENRRG